MISRRQFLIAASATAVVGGAAALVSTATDRPAYQWRGAALGGEARIALYDQDLEAAEEAARAVAAEIERLEALFSLYRADSQLSRLNTVGRLDAPARDVSDLIARALEWRTRTEGAFDPTVQPFFLAAKDGRDPGEERARVGTAVTIAPDHITLEASSALTLNGIAQGLITDSVTALLLRRGFREVVVDAGELRFPGSEPRPLGVPAAKIAVRVSGVAVATSDVKTLMFDKNAARHHLFDPKTGQSSRHWLSVSVFAPSAEMADALSTAFAVSPREKVADLCASLPDVAVIAADPRGQIHRFGSRKLTARA